MTLKQAREDVGESLEAVTGKHSEGHFLTQICTFLQGSSRLSTETP